MFHLSLFGNSKAGNKRNKQDRQFDPNGLPLNAIVRGEDGFTARDRAIWNTFQATIESEIASFIREGIDTADDTSARYDALRYAHKWARVDGHIVTLTTLHAAYNDALFADYQFAYSRR